jgi:hypothetical protein
MIIIGHFLKEQKSRLFIEVLFGAIVLDCVYRSFVWCNNIELVDCQLCDTYDVSHTEGTTPF